MEWLSYRAFPDLYLTYCASIAWGIELEPNVTAFTKIQGEELFGKVDTNLDGFRGPIHLLGPFAVEQGRGSERIR
jgi:hypothetical protein